MIKPIGPHSWFPPPLPRICACLMAPGGDQFVSVRETIAGTPSEIEHLGIRYNLASGFTDGGWPIYRPKP